MQPVEADGMNTIKIFGLVALAAVMLAGLQGCGGGGGDQYAGGGIGGSGVTVGSVSGFGSVFVNGVEFDTTGAVVVVDGAERGTGDRAVLDHLAIGKVVRVEGPLDADGSGTAQRIVYNEDIIGPVTEAVAVDADTLRLTVMGQTVIVDALTHFEATALADIAAGQFVEVSGFFDESGVLSATYFRRIADAMPPGAEVQLRGFTAGVDALTRVFSINRLEIDYAAADVSGLPGGTPANGQYAEVKGFLNAGGILAAASVAPESILGVENADNIEIAGIVNEFVSLTDFKVGGVPVTTDDATEYKGILPDDIGVGSFLIVKGSLIDGGAVADRIQSTAPIMLESTVIGIDIGMQRLTLAGLAATTVQANELTRFVGAARSLEEVQEDNYVKVFGKSYASGTVTASKIIALPRPRNTVSIKGPVSDKNGNVLTLLGVKIDTALLPENGFSLEDGTRLDRETFVRSAAEADTVTARGLRNGDLVNWQSIELAEGR
jgi:hypothetical protein